MEKTIGSPPLYIYFIDVFSTPNSALAAGPILMKLCVCAAVDSKMF